VRLIVIPEKKIHHSRDVIGMIAAADEGFARSPAVYRWTFQFEPGFMIRQWHGDGPQVLLVVGFRSGLGVLQQGVNRIFLSLGPQTFSSDEGAHRRENVHA
jgi:hypothetical protein